MSKFKMWLMKELYRTSEPERDSQIMQGLGGLCFGVVCLAALISRGASDVMFPKWFTVSAFAGLVVLGIVYLIETFRDKRAHLAFHVGEGIWLILFGVVYITRRLSLGLWDDWMGPVVIVLVMIAVGIFLVVKTILQTRQSRTS